MKFKNLTGSKQGNILFLLHNVIKKKKSFSLGKHKGNSRNLIFDSIRMPPARCNSKCSFLYVPQQWGLAQAGIEESKCKLPITHEAELILT